MEPMGQYAGLSLVHSGRQSAHAGSPLSDVFGCGLAEENCRAGRATTRSVRIVRYSFPWGSFIPDFLPVYPGAFAPSLSLKSPCWAASLVVLKSS
jgi:hypothetical protein